MRKALISVTDKTGLKEIAECFQKHNIEIISTGGTGDRLKELGIKFTPIEEITKNPECFDGRVKTLSFQVESGILFDRNNDNHQKQAKDLKVDPIDFVIVNLYPFEEVSRKHPDNLKKLIENIDIGGPTLLRSAAKNYETVSVLTSPTQYKNFITEMNSNNGFTSLASRKKYALSVFKRTQNYDSHIARSLAFNLEDEGLLRYGENPHQEALVIKTEEKGLLAGKKIQGKEFSYNNYLDMAQAWELVSELNHFISQKVSTAVIKHGGPCGVSSSITSLKALTLAWQGDPVSAFGSIVATSSELGEDEANFLSQYFIEIVMAPSFSEKALQIFSKKKNLRVYQLPLLDSENHTWEERSLPGAKLIQRKDSIISKEFENTTTKKFKESHKELIPFGIIASKYLKSNAIAIVSKSNGGDFWLTGSGAGQPNRLDSFNLASKKFKEILNKSKGYIQETLLVSDAFFPFDDIVKLCAKESISYILQPGGSIKDDQVIRTCDELKLAMTMTGKRHFKH